jgi:hypothetical protein
MKTISYFLALFCASAISCSNSANQVVILETPIITNLHSGTQTNLNGVFFENNNKGYSVGDSGVVLTTTNGGTDWERVSIGTSVSLGGYYVSNSKH